uniref:cadherin-7-like n=1 Tax=Myxine glutinosa TaxID=7769 RepID=UPI00358E79AE
MACWPFCFLFIALLVLSDQTHASTDLVPNPELKDKGWVLHAGTWGEESEDKGVLLDHHILDSEELGTDDLDAQGQMAADHMGRRTKRMANQKTDVEGHGLSFKRRVRRSWVWNQFFVLEEFKMPDPLNIGKLHSDQDPGDGSVVYLLSGEGAGSLFEIDNRTGDIHVTEALDRERQAIYTLLAQVVDRASGLPLEPPSQFIVKVQDINDNEPRFPAMPYIATVPERAPTGTLVLQVSATDADDASYGNSARVMYRILQGQPYFSIDPHTGEIRTALPDLDREARSSFQLVIEAKDMAGQRGGLAGTTTVTISLGDVNDNPPSFPQQTYRMAVSEGSVPGSEVGRLSADDPDEGQNRLTTFRLRGGDGTGVFSISTDRNTQEGVISLAQPVDYEGKQFYSLIVEAANSVLDPRFHSLGPFSASTRVLVSVMDADEAPVFRPATYSPRLLESAPLGSPVVMVTAKDPDAADRPVRYAIDRNTDLQRVFNIDHSTGNVVLAKTLDRENQEWHNISVLAIQSDNSALVGRANVKVQVLDVNDNLPELLGSHEVQVCESSVPGQLVHTLLGHDQDTGGAGRVHFTLLPSAAASANFTLRDNQNGSASLMLRKRLWLGDARSPMTVPLLLNDEGRPRHSASFALLVRVCACGRSGEAVVCGPEALALPAGLSLHALIAILACLLTLLVLVLLFVSVRRRQKASPPAPEEDDVRENIVRYDEEGGGEEDTATFDLITLTYPHIRGNEGAVAGSAATVRKDVQPEPSCPGTPGLHLALSDSEDQQQGKPAGGSQTRNQVAVRAEDCQPTSAIDAFIRVRLQQADADPCVPPFDSVQVYGYEGCGSLAGSLSSLESQTQSPRDQESRGYDFLRDWGPRFLGLAKLYGASQSPSS